MFNQDPYWLIPVTTLSSDRLFYHHLMNHANQHSTYTNGQQNENNILTSAARDYQHYYGGRLRNEDIVNNINHWCYKESHINVLDILTELANHFLLWQGDCFEVKGERLESWLMICSLLDPAWIISTAYSQLVKQKVLSEDDLISLLTGRQCPFAFPGERNDTVYADNHVHFNGHGYTSLSMLSFIDGDFRLNKKIKWPRREEYTLFESGLLNKQKIPDYLSGYVSCIIKFLSHSDKNKAIEYRVLEDALHGSSNNEDVWNIQQVKQFLPFVTMQQRLLHASVDERFRGHHRWLLFCIAVLTDTHNTDYRNCLMNFVRCSNVLRNYMVVSSVGLGQFVEYFTSGVRRADKKYFESEGMKYDFLEGVCREYRVSPDYVLGKNKPNIYHNKIMDFYARHEKENILEKSHLVVHFTRGYPDKKRPNDKRLESYRANLLSQVRGLEMFNSSVTLQEEAYKSNIGDMPQTVDVRRLVRGYDVAGNENELPIEVFSPILRVLRAGKHPKGLSLSTRLQRPFITVHAGEDYSHLLSGLRALDEAVEYCLLSVGDRLGHGLALGVKPASWAKRQRRAYLTAGQHLDNLVWAYHQAVQLSQLTVEHIPVMHELRDKIHYWSHRLYNAVSTPGLLYQAWLLRRNWPDFKTMQPELANFYEWVPDADLLMNDDDHKDLSPKTLWQRYLDSGLEENNPFNHIISVNCQPDGGDKFAGGRADTDVISCGELRLYEAIQDFLMEKYSRKGLVIEACPTSNIYIGRFEKYQEHPLFRWNPPNPDWLKPGGQCNRFGLRSGPLAVCINTDDSALMPTTIANEHRLMRETAIQSFGIGAWMADMWIDAIRRKGIDIFNKNHINQY
ncbi:antiviral RADAR system adenosine deaminase RdrB [Enterobacter sp. HNDS-6]|uniref:antiviral RADAR system adenosine deaminase RdrB n=1 Tax=Enterobacter sp. HNDS-6 TaxID=3151599 RepID=UPI00325AE0E8